LAWKIGGGFGLCLLMTGVITWVALSGFGLVRQSVDSLASDSLEGVVALGRFDAAIRQERIFQFRIAAHEEADVRTKLAKNVEGEIEKADAALKDYGASVYQPADRENYQALGKMWSDYKAKSQELAPQMSTLPPKDAIKLFEDETNPLFLDTLKPQLEKMENWNAEDGKHAALAAKASLASGTQTILLFLLGAIVAGIAFTVIVVRGVRRPIGLVADRVRSLQAHCLKDLTAGVEALAAGDLTFAVKPVTTFVPDPSGDEIGTMAKDFNKALELMHVAINAYNAARHSLSEIISQVAENSMAVAGTSQTLAASSEESGAASNEIAAGSQKLASGATEAAAVMEQLAAQVDNVGKSSQAQRKHVHDADQALAEAAAAASGSAEAVGSPCSEAVDQILLEAAAGSPCNEPLDGPALDETRLGDAALDKAAVRLGQAR